VTTETKKTTSSTPSRTRAPTSEKTQETNLKAARISPKQPRKAAVAEKKETK
jgi:hypothetical protein